MKALLLVLLVAVLVSLTGCGKNQAPPLDVSLVKPRLDRPDSVSLKECAGPVAIPGRPLTQKEVETYWGADVDRLLACKGSKHVLISYILQRDLGIAGTPAKGN